VPGSIAATKGYERSRNTACRGSSRPSLKVRRCAVKRTKIDAFRAPPSRPGGKGGADAAARIGQRHSRGLAPVYRGELVSFWSAGIIVAISGPCSNRLLHLRSPLRVRGKYPLIIITESNAIGRTI
jgi:hypothetical protein